jgi:hypothetical protein
MKRLFILLLVALSLNSCNKKHQHKVKLELVSQSLQDDGTSFDKVGFIRGMNDVKIFVQPTQSSVSWEEVTDIASSITYRLECTRHDNVEYTYNVYHNDKLVKTSKGSLTSYITVNISDDGTIK